MILIGLEFWSVSEAYHWAKHHMTSLLIDSSFRSPDCDHLARTMSLLGDDFMLLLTCHAHLPFTRLSQSLLFWPPSILPPSPTPAPSCLQLISAILFSYCCWGLPSWGSHWSFTRPLHRGLLNVSQNTNSCLGWACLISIGERRWQSQLGLCVRDGGGVQGSPPPKSTDEQEICGWWELKGTLWS